MKKVSVLSLRIQKASRVIENYLENPESVIDSALSELGVDDSDIGLSLLDDFITFEVFKDALDNTIKDLNIPIPRLKMVWSILQEKDKNEKKEVSDTKIIESLLKANRPIQQWTNLELLENYNKEGQIAIHDELMRRSKGRFVIIFNDDLSIDLDNSYLLLKKSQFQETPQIFKIKSGVLKEVYRVGDFPMQLFYECPVHKDTLLLDGYCEECTTYWEVDNTEYNVFLRLITEVEKVDIRLYKNKSLDALQSLFPKIYLMYKSLKEEGKLPSLKRKISKPNQGDPFRVIGTHKVY